ncbi:uncharacterized protein LOC128223172 [Mya arenaria]|uniref:uncharacterized protein LOC128223172 n=1 Tax=Mya arenaria TaxID=6604 RepID=UPI0022E97349|nr:uncharacterized protein LOC128223172 [Mya arenaria]
MTTACNDLRNCEDVDGWECYNATVLAQCCNRCEHEREFPVIKDCLYGDRQDHCNVGVHGYLCYNETLRYNCCESCHGYETGIQGCQYGDNRTVGCDTRYCGTYKPLDCCYTCRNTINLPTTSTVNPGGNRNRNTYSPNTTDSGTTDALQTSAGLPVWVIVVMTFGVVALLLLLVTLATFLYRRHRKSHSKGSRDDRKASDRVALSQRAPVPVPRPDSTKTEWDRERRPSAEYDYINPDHLENSSSRRSVNDPLPLAPPDYLDLEAAHGSYGYLIPSNRNSASSSGHSGDDGKHPVYGDDNKRGNVETNSKNQQMTGYNYTKTSSPNKEKAAGKGASNTAKQVSGSVYSHLEANKREDKGSNSYQSFPVDKERRFGSEHI